MQLHKALVDMGSRGILTPSTASSTSRRKKRSSCCVRATPSLVAKHAGPSWFVTAYKSRDTDSSLYFADRQQRLVDRMMKFGVLAALAKASAIFVTL